MTNRKAFLVLLALLTCSCFAQAENDKVVSDMGNQLKRLRKVNFHPNLLPIILKHSDYMDLSAEQVAVFKSWGRENFKPMVGIMNEIIRKRIEFKEAALSRSVSAETLRSQQEEIFQLHRKLLGYKLSCRENIMQLFTDENWEGFAMVLGEEGYAIPDTGVAAEFATLNSGK